MTKGLREAQIIVFVKYPGQKMHFDLIDNKLEAFQEIVGGYIECVRLPEKNVIMIVNEEGKLRGMRHNFYCDDDDIVGPVVFCSAKDDEFCSLIPGAYKHLVDRFDERK